VKIDKKWGFVNNSGETIIKPQFDWVGDFSEGLAVIQVGEKQGYLDKNGKIVVEPKFDFASEFSEGLAWVLEDCESKEFTFSYIDKTGKPVSIIGRNFEFGLNFSEGLAAVFVDDKVRFH